MTKYSDTISESYVTYTRRSGSMKRKKNRVMRRRKKIREQFIGKFVRGIGRAVSKGVRTVGRGIGRVGRVIGSTVGRVGRSVGRTVKSIASKVSKGVWRALKWIGSMTKKVLKKALGFFGKIWNFLKKIIFGVIRSLWWPFTSFFKFIKWLLSRIVQFALATVLGPLGQLIVRNVFLNGSLDKKWLMYLPIFPFTLIGGWYFLLGAVKKGKGPKTMDLEGIILSVISGIIPWFVSLIFPSHNWLFAIVYPLCLYVFYVFMFYRRDRKRCGKEGFKLGKLLRSANTMTMIAGVIVPLIIMAICCGASGLLGDGNLYVKTKLEHLGLLKFYLFFSTIFGVSGYLITNMQNNSIKYCRPYPVKKAAKGTIMTIASLVLWNMIELIISNINCPEGEC